MKSQRSLDQVAVELAEADRVLKKAEKAKEDLRSEFFFCATEQVKSERVLKRRALTIPKEFFHLTKMSFEDFVASRYPTWRLAEYESESMVHQFVLIIEEDPEYLPFEYIHAETREVVSRQVASAPPQVDTNTLKAEFPAVWEKIMKPVVVYELNDEALTTAVVEDPSLVGVLQRHYCYPRKPSKKLGPIRVAKEEE